MSCEIPGEVLRYITSVENDMPKACKEQHALGGIHTPGVCRGRYFCGYGKSAKIPQNGKIFSLREAFPVGRVFVDALGLYIPEERDAKMEDAVLHGGTGKRKRRFYRI